MNKFEKSIMFLTILLNCLIAIAIVIYWLEPKPKKPVLPPQVLPQRKIDSVRLKQGIHNEVERQITELLNNSKIAVSTSGDIIIVPQRKTPSK